MIREGGRSILTAVWGGGVEGGVEKKGRFRLLSALIPSYLLQKAAEAITSTAQL